MSNINFNKDVQVDEVQLLARKKIFFAHQSVGLDIINGIKDIVSNYNIKGFKIIETARSEDFEQPIFAHNKVGANTHPLSKLAEFEKIMASGVGKNVDIAFLKFCYVDVIDKTDVKELFSRYLETMDRLRANYPEVKFVHFTVPVTTNEAGFKTRIKVLTGMGDLWEYRDNIRRNEFNSLLLQRYSQREPVFDMAKMEAATIDGKLTTFSLHGKEWLSLNPSFTSDGGHLNAIGRQKIANQLLIFIASLSR